MRIVYIRKKRKLDFRGEVEIGDEDLLDRLRISPRVSMSRNLIQELLRQGLVDEAVEWTRQGISLKPFLGFGYAADRQEIAAIRQAVGDEARIFMDGVWQYSLPEAIRVGRMLEAHGVEFFEAPLLPEDIARRFAFNLDATEMDVSVTVDITALKSVKVRALRMYRSQPDAQALADLFESNPWNAEWFHQAYPAVALTSQTSAGFWSS